MKPSHEFHHAEPEVVIEFLKRLHPFRDLPEATIKNIASNTLIDFFPRGSLIFQQQETEVSFLYLIQRGGVKIFIKDSEGEITLTDFRGEGESFGALPIIQGGKANLSVETVEDTFCFLIKKEAILKLIESYPAVAQHYLQRMTDKLAGKIYAELRHHRVAPKAESSLYLFSARIENISKGELYTAPTATTIQEAAKKMADNNIGSLLIEDEAGKIAGIITDKDLRCQVVAEGLDYSTPVTAVMTNPIRTIPSHAVCFDALIKMMHNKIHHLAVEKGGRIVGMVTTHDIMVLQGNSPLYFFRDILNQKKISGLYAISAKVPQIVRHLIEEGAKANNITRMITILNDHIMERLLSLLIEEIGAPPLKFCWLLMGSEGRREQTFRTDQDNAIIHETAMEERQYQDAQEYFRILSEKASTHLAACGYPRCKGEIMAANPKWCQPVRVWRDYFIRWLSVPDSVEILQSTIFFDFRAGFGETVLAENLRSFLTPLARKEDIFLLHLAKDCLNTKPPLTFFKNFIVEKDGAHKNTLDLKVRGIAPFVDFARIKALQHGIEETNTQGRLELLRDGGHLSQDLVSETIEAYEFLMHLRLIHQMHLIETGKQPDNHVNPGDLTDLEKQTLKEAFSIMQRIQNVIRQDFRLE